MYGQIHLAIRELVITKFGKEAWRKILKQTDLNDIEDFMVFHRYADERTFALVGAVSQVLDLSVESVLEAFGAYFFEYLLKHGYDKMLRTLGNNLVSFLQNLDSLHALLAMSYKNIVAPSFRCETSEDGVVILHYYSIRPGLHPIVQGLVREVGLRLFDTESWLELLEVTKEHASTTAELDHVTFRVHMRGPDIRITRPFDGHSSSDEQNMVVRAQLDQLRCQIDSRISDNLVSAHDFCQLFPYHVVFQDSLHLRQCGIAIQRLCTILIGETRLDHIFSLTHPVVDLTFANIRKFQQQVFVLNLQERSQDLFSLKGQMVYLEDIKCMLFLCSPRLGSLDEMESLGMFMSDIPLYDVTRELVLLNQQRIAEIEISKQLDETTAELKKTSSALEVEKKKTDTLLYQMLPRKVADKLKIGEKVEAEKFDSVTILFSDIVSFTQISSASTPMQIVDLLNDMYLRFDNLTEKHDVYKVETIGDAYMVVAGVPTRADDHAPKVAMFALDMVSEASQTKSPIPERCIQIRVGIHTGPVVAGVVGLKMPRYCLFGDTVNTASRMESHSKPSCIHVSSSTHTALKHTGCRFQMRGSIDVKGKGMMQTYFLLAGSQHKCETTEVSSQNDTGPLRMSDATASDDKISKLCALL